MTARDESTVIPEEAIKCGGVALTQGEEEKKPGGACYFFLSSPGQLLPNYSFILLSDPE